MPSWWEEMSRYFDARGEPLGSVLTVHVAVPAGPTPHGQWAMGNDQALIHLEKLDNL